MRNTKWKNTSKIRRTSKNKRNKTSKIKSRKGKKSQSNKKINNRKKTTYSQKKTTNSRKKKNSNKKNIELLTIKNRKIITNYKKNNRCCYLLKNGKRCKNKCIGIRNIKSLKTGESYKTFIMQCKIHRKICGKKYLKYKNFCNKVTENTNRKNFIKSNVCNNKTKKEKREIIKNIDKCINGRLEYPMTCSNGCIVNPNNFKSYKLAKINDKQHLHEVIYLIKNKIKCKKN